MTTLEHKIAITNKAFVDSGSVERLDSFVIGGVTKEGKALFSHIADGGNKMAMVGALTVIQTKIQTEMGAKTSSMLK